VKEREEKKKMEGGRDEGWWEGSGRDGWMYVHMRKRRSRYQSESNKRAEQRIPPLRSCVMYTVTDSLIAVPYIYTRPI